MTGKDAATMLAKRRAQALTPQRRREIARRGGATFRENARRRAHQRHLWTAILGAVDVLFQRISEDSKQRALFVHMGEVLVMTTENSDYRRLVEKHPASLVGVYNHRSIRKQVFDDIQEVTDRLAQAFQPKGRNAGRITRER